MPGLICLFISEEHLQRAEHCLADLLWWKFSCGAASTSSLNKFFQRTSDYCLHVFGSKVNIRVSISLFVCVHTPFCCRCMEQPSSSMSLTRKRNYLSVSAHSLACPALIWDLMGPGVFTATRASVFSPTGPSSSPSEAFSHSSTDTPSLDHMPCPLKS